MTFVTIPDTGDSTARVRGIFKRELALRGVKTADNGFSVTFLRDAALENDVFSITDDKNGVIIRAGGAASLLHGAGMFLRGCTYVPEFIPCSHRGVVKPACPLRGAYFASHFHNYYHVASAGDLELYVEQLGLWGFNLITVILPSINIQNQNDPEFTAAINRMKNVFVLAHDLGMKTGTLHCPDAVFIEFPEEYRAKLHADQLGRRGNTGNNICPAEPGANEYAMSINRLIIENIYPAPLDIFVSWPYDEGGCGCEKCFPWGGNGFIRCSKELFSIVREYYPEILRCVSTWCFDTPEEGEWDALYESLRDEKWCDIIMADSHTDFPRYPLENGRVRDIPFVSFPEISMWGLYPWGGYGANPLPRRFTKLFEQVSGILSGGFLYSEGIYEDFNKAIVAQLWVGGASWRDTSAEYARYECGVSNTDEFNTFIEMLETHHSVFEKTGKCDLGELEKIYSSAKKIDVSLPLWGASSWRWRQLYLRAQLTLARCTLASQNNWDLGAADSLIYKDGAYAPAFRELREIYRMTDEYPDDPYHGRVRPGGV